MRAPLSRRLRVAAGMFGESSRRLLELADAMESAEQLGPDAPEIIRAGTAILRGQAIGEAMTLTGGKLYSAEVEAAL